MAEPTAISAIRPRVQFLLLAMVAMQFLSGCYVMHVARGQSQVLSARKPIPAVIANPQTPEAVRTQLERVLQMREFAVNELGLPDNSSYRSYADLRRAYVVWNVFAAPEFSVEPRQWCFPIAGCVAYRGYFSEKKARRFAGRLLKEGSDVFVGGVPAYSTLGHFDDPVLNTMMHWSDVQLASILFHELTHQLLYVPSDSQFNEALATVVEDEGVKRWLAHLGREKELERYRVQKQRYLEAAQLFIDARARLRQVYASGAPPDLMRRQKQEVLTELARQYAQLKQAGGGGTAGFDEWVAQGVNNAQLASLATYKECVPGLTALLEENGEDLKRFYEAARGLAKLDREARHRKVCVRPMEK